jgi:YebC/PmpR family DNA-binding regulatory protein
MSGHSKWANIKHRKAAQDAKRGKVFTRLGKELTIAAKHGGGDPESNFKLRTIVDKARAANMPTDNIDRAIKRGTGEIPGVNYEEQLYEGYGPEGVAVLVECLTDNKNRTVSEMRRLFSSNGGTMADAGAVNWMFEKKGVIRVTAPTLSEDTLLEQLLDCNIDDIDIDDAIATITTSPKYLETIKKALADLGYKIESAEVESVAKNLVALSPDKTQKVIDFLERLEEQEDVQNIYSNLA